MYCAFLHFIMENKMKVEITACLSGPDVLYNVGDIVDVSKKDALRLFEAGFAIPVRTKKSKKEKAVK